MENLNIALFQYDIQWEDKPRNFTFIEQWLKELPKDTDLVVLPEMFSTGFTMNPDSFGETRKGESVQRLTQLSHKYQVAFCGSMIVKESEEFRNALFLLQHGKDIQWYDKKHLFTYGGESKAYEAGSERVLFTFQGWKIFPFICYDLRFPVWLRNDQSADLYIGVANWPDVRIEAWRQLLKARAIENQTYVIGVNRIGKEPKGLNYTGFSAAIDYSGALIEELKGAEWRVVQINKSSQNDFRERLPFLVDRDKFILK